MLEFLHLANFRNYQELDLDIGHGLLVIAGPNGSGKSNLCEAIFYLGAGYSYRQCHEETMIRFGSSFSAVKGRVSQGGLLFDLEINYQQSTRRKLFKVNGKRELPGKAAAYFPVVIFSPADLLLLQGSPANRRRFIDLVTAQEQPQYASLLHHYCNILYQRNNLLKQGVGQDSLLAPWNEQLAVAGAKVIILRIRTLNRLIRYGSANFELLGGKGRLEVEYSSEVLGRQADAGEEACRALFREALQRSRPREARYKATVVGPHRDDLKMMVDGREARLYSSQGEQRLVALSMKMGQYQLLDAVQHNEPLLLLDDVFSELDQLRRKLLFDELMKYRQIIATTTSYRGASRKKLLISPDVTVFYL